MGGPGSGNRWRWDKRDTTGEHRSIDVRAWARDGSLTPGNHFFCSWSRGGERTATIGVEVAPLPFDRDRAWLLVLDYRYRRGGGEWEDVRQPVFLAWTPCRYGGVRPWFRCSADGCGRRVALLYGAGRYFACRHCYRLAYDSTREDVGNRHLSRAQAIRRRLGGSANMLEPFPPKPKGMHWRTYLRLWREEHAAEEAYDAAFWMKWGNVDALLRRMEGG